MDFDLDEIKKPSTSTFITINLAESAISKDIIEMIYEGLSLSGKNIAK